MTWWAWVLVGWFGSSFALFVAFPVLARLWLRRRSRRVAVSIDGDRLRRAIEEWSR